MVTGRVPYDAESPVSVALKHIQEPVVPPKNINDNVPENLNKLILKAIEKEPIKRYQTAKDMLIDLQRIQKDSAYTITSSSMENEYTRVMAPVNVLDYENEEVSKNGKNNIDKKNKTKIIVSVAIIVLIILLSIGGMIYKGVFSNTKNTGKTEDKLVVPKIIGLEKVAAKTLVESKHLTFSEIGQENSDLPKGTVTVCWPEEGTEMKENQEVRVRVSKGPETFPVPYVKGLDKISAKAMIEQGGLTLGSVTEEFSDTIASGIVINQDPSAEGLVQKGDKVNLVISKGAEVKLTKVPDLFGRSISEAGRVLQNSNLKLGDTKEVETSDKLQDGKVFNQTIPVNTDVKQGNSVGVSYYKYKEPVKEQFDVPDFIGKTVKEAKDLAAASDITISAPGSDEDIIDTQDKPAGSKANVGDTITLTSKPGTPVTPPPAQ